MKVLLLYATYSSGTATVSEIIEKELVLHNISVTRMLVSSAKIADLASYDALILGSPSWKIDDKEGQPHEFYQAFFESANGLSLADKKVAVFGLGDSSYMTFCGAANCLEQFVTEHQGVLALPSLRIDGFYYAQEANMALAKDWALKLAAHLGA